MTHTIAWSPSLLPGVPVAVALVLHGLNINPQRMQPLVEEINHCGLDVLRLACMGHGANFLPVAGLDEPEARLAALGRVTYTLWQDEVTAAYRIAAQRAARCGVPVVLAGFSLGGLLGCAAALASAQVRFAKLVLFAPALRVHRRSKILKALARWPQIVIPSATPIEYRANRGTTIAAYNALYAAQAFCERVHDERLNVPTLVFVDPRDELVSAAGLRSLAAERHLTRWQFYDVHKGEDAQTRYHHLIIDSPSVGSVMWRQMMARMASHLAAEI